MTSTSAPPIPGTVLRRLIAVLGWLSVFMTLALLSPGVFTARADELSDPAGPSCQASRSPEQITLELNQMIERLRARAEAKGGDQGDIVVLNTRGYNYGPTAEPPASLLHGEGERAN